MLYQVQKFFKHQPSINELIYSEGPLSIKLNDEQITSMIVQKFKYEIESLLPPTIHSDGKKKYITPMWIEVHPQTQSSDIEWKRWVSSKEKQRQIDEKKNNINEWQFESSSKPGHFYTVKQTGNGVKCNCPGVWRSHAKTCKHMLKVLEMLKK